MKILFGGYFEVLLGVFLELFLEILLLICLWLLKRDCRRRRRRKERLSADGRLRFALYKDNGGRRVLAGQAGRKRSGGRETSFACIKRRRAAKSCWRNAKFRIPADEYCTGCRMLH